MRTAPYIMKTTEAPDIYLAGVNTATAGDLELTTGRRVLESFAFISASEWVDAYRGTWKSAMLDSGAFSVQSTGTPVDLGAYRAFIEARGSFYDSMAALDVISDWRQSVKNWRAMEDLGVFPTYHEGEPLDLLVDYAQEQASCGGWVGFGAQRPINPERLTAWLAMCREAVGHLASSARFHGFGMTMYSTAFPFSSTDSNTWARIVRKFLTLSSLNHLTRGEMLSIGLARMERAHMRTAWDPNWPTLLSKVEAKRSALKELGGSTVDMFSTTEEVGG